MRFSAKLVKSIYIIFALALLTWLTVSLWPIIVPFFFAVLFAYILQPAVGFLLKRRLKPSIAILLTYLCLFLLLYLLLFWCVPLIWTQMAKLLVYLPTLMEGIQEWWLSVQESLKRLSPPAAVIEAISNTMTQGGAYLTRLVENAAVALVNLTRYLLYLLLAPILSYYMLRDKDAFQKVIVAALSPKERPEIMRIANDVNHLLRQFVYGYLLVSLIIGALTAAFLWLIGVDYAILLGILMGIADFIPYFGPVVASVPIIFLAYLQSPTLAIYTALGMVVLQQIEGNIITPKVMGDRIGLHPLATIFVVMAGGYWFGILGSVLAVPITAALALIIKYIYSRLVAYVE